MVTGVDLSVEPSTTFIRGNLGMASFSAARVLYASLVQEARSSRQRVLIAANANTSDSNRHFLDQLYRYWQDLRTKFLEDVGTLTTQYDLSAERVLRLRA